MSDVYYNSADKKVVSYYYEQLREMTEKEPDMMLDHNEVEEAISKIFHTPTTQETMWLGGKQRATEFMKTLQNFQ